VRLLFFALKKERFAHLLFSKERLSDHCFCRSLEKSNNKNYRSTALFKKSPIELSNGRLIFSKEQQKEQHKELSLF